MKSITIILITLIISGSACAQNLVRRLDSLLQGHVNRGEIHGCRAYVYQKGSVLIDKSYGMMDIENRRPMEYNAIFRIASMTKALTAATALRLYEDGKFLLDDPVRKYIPEFTGLRVIAPGCDNEDSLRTIPLERDVTVRDLFRHTAGFGYGGTDIVGRVYTKKIRYDSAMTLRQFVQRITSAPLKYQPGSKWEYSFANDVLGYLVEVVSGQPLDSTMKSLLLKPLGMDDTGFFVPAEKISRLCHHYTYTDGRLTLTDGSIDSKFNRRPAFISGGGGAVSTIDDYSKFCRMLLQYGEYNGKRILRPETVTLMTANQIGEIKERGFALPGFGLGIGVIPARKSGGTSACYWAGAPYNDTYIFNYDKQTVAILLLQNGPWTHLGLMDSFRKVVDDETKK